ncbi:3-hydroxyacyl-ACP dehydratase FabZ family protein [Streptomyces sp. NPDC003011]
MTLDLPAPAPAPAPAHPAAAAPHPADTGGPARTAPAGPGTGAPKDGPPGIRPAAGVPVSPVAAVVHVEHRNEEGLPLVARAEIGAGEPVFAGHYPHFPIFPGVCVLECVQRAATDGAAAPSAAALAAVESARFVGAVRPGDTLRLTLRWRTTGAGLRCDAVAETARGRAATVRLRYEPAGGAR